jgi:hypothetical protein
VVLLVIAAELLFVVLILALLTRAPTGVLGYSIRRSDVRADWRLAQERAEVLLHQLLTPEERELLARRGYLEVPSRIHSGWVYRIPRHQGQIKVLEDDAPILALCVQSVEPIPDADAVILHKLMIEGDEESYLRIANRFEPSLYGFIAIRPRMRV